jgi:hypothetical protein
MTNPGRETIMSTNDENIQRGVTAQLEALNLIERWHLNDRQGFDDLYAIAVSTPEDLVRASTLIADMALALPQTGDYEFRLGQIRKAFSRAGGA